MANELNIALSTGLTVTAQPFTAGAASGSPISLTEVSTSGFYSGDMTGASGTYQLVFLSGGATVGTGQINWSGTAEIPFSTLTTADIPSAASVASAVWSAATKEITGGTVDTLTNAPESVTPADIWDYNNRTLTSASGPTAVEIRQEIDANSTKLDVAVGTRLADADYVEPANSDVAAIKGKTDLLETTRLAQCSTVATTGAQLAAALS